MQNKNYSEHLKGVLSVLFYVQENLYDGIVALAFSGIYLDIAEVHENNEVEMDPAYFEDTDDANVEMLMSLWKRIWLTREKIMDLNSIEDDEVFDDS